MRILVLSKRQYLGKDMLDDRFFRNYEIPEVLARQGHDVQGFTLSYRPRSQGHMRPGKVDWTSVNAIPNLPNYFRKLNQKISDWRPDIIWASSDIYHALIAWRIHLRYKLPFVVDLYDNYESFGASRVPGIIPLFRTACRAAAGLTLISHSLEHFVVNNYGIKCPRRVIGNAIRSDVFQPKSKMIARETLGLPAHARLVGTAGAISANRGIQAMFEAFLALAVNDPDLWLVYAGPRDATPQHYSHERIVDLGELPHDRIGDVFNALDVAIICNLDSAFGRYCFPQKLYEIIACERPLTAAAVGDVAQLLSPWPQTLFEPMSAESLMDRLKEQLVHPTLIRLKPPGWDEAGADLEVFLRHLIH